MIRLVDYSITNKNMFDRKNKKVVKIVWMVLSILVVVSMILLYMPGLFS